VRKTIRPIRPATTSVMIDSAMMQDCRPQSCRVKPGVLYQSDHESSPQDGVVNKLTLQIHQGREGS
jgi:hypothetical protein